VKGYTTTNYYPMYISRAFMEYCLYDDVNDIVILESFLKFVAVDEEELIDEHMGSGQVPDDDELFDFLSRFQCRTEITSSNLTRIITELGRQELIQKPHVMLASFKPIVKELKHFEPFKTSEQLHEFYDTIRPTTKKVLHNLSAQPNTDAERDAYKFLQRYIRGLDESKLLQFLKFTTASDIMVAKPLEVHFVKVEGVSSRPIAHTCGPVLELPSTYSNFVELREQFNNILDKKSWGFDMM
jgi:hypothetical protein